MLDWREIGECPLRVQAVATGMHIFSNVEENESRHELKKTDCLTRLFFTVGVEVSVADELATRVIPFLEFFGKKKIQCDHSKTEQQTALLDLLQNWKRGLPSEMAKDVEMFTGESIKAFCGSQTDLQLASSPTCVTLLSRHHLSAPPGSLHSFAQLTPMGPPCLLGEGGDLSGWLHSTQLAHLPWV